MSRILIMHGTASTCSVGVGTDACQKRESATYASPCPAGVVPSPQKALCSAEGALCR